ncbi:MAG: tail fiber domain-containing protein [Bacteroidia bacterium]|nr:tail fiber domain-containing protein [Bacteroidia bacterium]
MKRNLALLYLIIICSFQTLHAQVPQGIQFQTVARQGSGVAMSNTNLTVYFRIQDGGGTTVYEESHAVTTDIYGLFDVVIGQGTVLSGSFPAIGWGTSNHQIQIDLDPGTGIVNIGTCDFQSVPYALYADKANMGMIDLTDVDLTGLAPGEVLVWDGTNWVPGSPGTSIWSQNLSAAHYPSGRVGIGIDTPVTTLQVRDTANVLFGTNLTGSGFKMIWYGQKGAFRAGYLNNPFGGYNYDKFWDYDSVGYYSFAAGRNSRAKGFGAFAFGSFGWADGSGSVAFFGSAQGNNSFTFGGSSKGRGSITFEGVADEEGGIAMYGYTGGRYGVSIGGGTTGLGASSSREDYAIAIGWNSDARGQASIALGPSDAYGYNSFSTGWVTEARGNYSSTFGYQTNSYPYASMALGRFNVITGDSASWQANDPIFMIGDGSSNAARSNSFTILKNGRTAVGYNNPVGFLNVSTALGSLSNAGNLDLTRASILIGTTTTGMGFDANQIETQGSSLYLNFNSAAEVRIAEGGGNVGIGLNPNARFEIEQSSNTVGGGLRLNANGGTAYWDIFYDAALDLQFARSGVAKASIDRVNGAYNQLSDIRVKRDIEELGSVLDNVLKLKPSTYFYKDNQASDERSIGFIAQEVEEIFPQLVKQGEVYKQLSYDDFAILAIKSIQEQQEIIDQQSQKLEQQQTQIDELSKLLQHLQSEVNALQGKN